MPSCSVAGCKGTAQQGAFLCPWHLAHGTPDKILAPGAKKPYLGRATRS